MYNMAQLSKLMQVAVGKSCTFNGPIGAISVSLNISMYQVSYDLIVSNPCLDIS